MYEEGEWVDRFSSDMTETIAHIWTHATISLMDVRHKSISADEPLRHYRLPSSMLVYTCGGPASVQLNGTVFSMERFGMFHGGKGTELTILPGDARLDAYMVLYKASNAPFYKRELQRLLEQANPFVQLFGYSPSNPVLLLDLFRKMLDNWNRAKAMKHFNAKNLFFQLMYEVYRELERDEARFLQPDPVISAKRYLNEHYMEPIMLQEIADLFAISGGQLTRLFKKREGKSLQEHLIQRRLDAARDHLLHSDATVKEIAAGCGFIDENNLLRMFKKRYKMAPSEYRKIKTWPVPDQDVDNDSHRSYNEKGLDSLAKSHRDGELTMFGQTRSKEMLFAAAMSLMLLLSACSSNATVNNGASSSPTPAQTQQSQPTASAESNGAEAAAQTRTIQTVFGDVEVPINPKRIAVWVYEQEVHSLGITPVAISGGNFQQVWPDAAVFSYAPEKEELMALEPDILITYDDENFFNEYSAIAPVVSIPLSNSSEDTQRLIGDLLNLSDKADQVVQDFVAQVDQSKALLEQAGVLGATTVLIEPLADTIWFYDYAYGRGGNTLYEYLEFAIPDVVQEQLGDKHFMNISLELLPEYCNADYIVVVTGDGYEQLKQKEIWQSLPAVKNNKVIEFDGSVLSGRGLDAATLSHFTESFVEKSS